MRGLGLRTGNRSTFWTGNPSARYPGQVLYSPPLGGSPMGTQTTPTLVDQLPNLSGLALGGGGSRIFSNRMRETCTVPGRSRVPG